MSEQVMLQLFATIAGIVSAVLLTVRMMVRSNEATVREFANRHAEVLRDAIRDIMEEQRALEMRITQAIRESNADMVQRVVLAIREAIRERDDGHRRSGA